MTNLKQDPTLCLATSRARIRIHLLSSATRSAAHGATSAHRSTSLWIHVLAEFAAMAQKGTSAQSFSTWWRSFPLSATLGSIAKMHPVRLVVCAAAAGAAIVWIRPWRWLSADTVTAALAAAVDLLTQAQPKDSVWSDFMDFVLQKKGPPQP